MRDFLLGSWLCGATIIITVTFLLMAWQTKAHAAECGLASYYGFESGSVTASGERFRPMGFSIAMRSHDFGRLYRIRFGGRSVVVRHNDFGPALSTGRRYDLSRGAAAALGMIQRGTGRICLERVG